MELFKSGLKSVLGGPQDAHQPTGAETVEKLVDRVVTSTLLEDRRDACRALRSLSKTFRVEVGAQAMDAFLQVLEHDQADNEIISYVLDAICNVISGVQVEDEMGNVPASDTSLGYQFTEIFIKKPENVSLLLNLMEEYDFKVRWPVVKLITALLLHKPKELQDCILVSPMGVSRLMDLLSDTREIIRNDTLLLLAHLTRGNANIQKIVAFENAFDKLLSIIKEEGYSDGGVVVQDCLMVLQTLLKNNSSNQTFFKEGSYIQHLAPFFDLQDSAQKGWSEQKATNIHMMLQVLRVLVSPNNPQQVTLFSQRVMFQCGLLEQLCNILMVSGVPVDVLTETINTVAEILRGNQANQEYFSNYHAPTTPPRPAIVVLLMSMVNEKQPFPLRCAVLYCFQCFLYKNELCQAQIIITLLPSTTDVLNYSVGQLLCGGLFSPDAMSNWFAAVSLSYTLVDNPAQKEELLRVQLATGVGNPPVSLLSHLSLILQQGGKLQTRLGLLMLMSTWLAHCPNAVSHFLSIATNIPFLTSQVCLAEHDESEDIVQGMCAFLLGICIEFNDNSEQCEPNCSKEDLCQLVVKRIGLEAFHTKLGLVSKNEYYIRASQNPHQKFQQPSEFLFDYEFCRLFKSLEGVIIKAMQSKPTVMNGPETTMTPAQQGHLKQYKDFIRDQDLQIQNLTSKLTEMTTEYENVKVQLDDMTSTVQQLKDQNALLKAQKSVSGNNQDSSLREEVEKLKSQLELQTKEINEKNEEIKQLNMQITNLTAKLNAVTVDCENAMTQLANMNFTVQQVNDPNTVSNSLVSDCATNPQLKDEVENLNAQLVQQQKEIEEKNKAIIQLRESMSGKGDCKSADQSESCCNHEIKIKNMEETIHNLQAEVESLKKSEEELKALKDTLQSTIEEKEKIALKLSTLTKEQEDMLILLTEQGDKLNEYKERLRALGESVIDDDDEVGEEGECYDLDEELLDLKDESANPSDINGS